MTKSVTDELEEAVQRVLRSTSPKKLIVAGPGAGKTTLFRKLLENTGGGRDDRLVVTFVNNLKEDLDRSLGDLAQVHTLHGYCQSLLRRHPRLRAGITGDFICYPGLISLIKIDWEWITGAQAPKFVDLMRRLECTDEQDAFYYERANYYDAVDFDDSVYRTLQSLRRQKEETPKYQLVLIDEFQDFNKLEASVIDHLASVSAIVIAGDDDQALYSQLRGASWEHIRVHHVGGEYEVFALPFCMRCPEVIVSAVNSIVENARRLNKLVGRIDKPYKFFEPAKGKDSRQFPKIDYVRTSVQRGNANYFGKYIERCIRNVSKEDFDGAAEKHEAAVLVIGSKPYLPQIREHLVACGLLDEKEEAQVSEREQALGILSSNPRSNLAWRIILSESDTKFAKPLVQTAHEKSLQLVDVIPEHVREAVLDEVRAFVEQRAKEPKEVEAKAASKPIKLTSYEGSKGLSAQYVFLIGVHADELPRNAAAPQDIEICKFLVGLTRTKKKCSVVVANNFAGKLMRPSIFLSWIDNASFELVEVTAEYWK